MTEADFIIARLQRERLVFAARALRAEMTIAALTVQLAYYKRRAERGYHNGYDKGMERGKAG